VRGRPERGRQRPRPRLALENCTPVIALQVLHYAPLDGHYARQAVDNRRAGGAEI
jgi:hypothetical protein